MTDPNALYALIQSARGGRPRSLSCQEAEDVLNVTLALLVELSVSNGRIDRLERLMAEARGESVDAFREIQFEGDAASERQAAMDALLMRAMRIFIDPRPLNGTNQIID